MFINFVFQLLENISYIKGIVGNDPASYLTIIPN